MSMRKIYVIGGANVDILARSYAPIIPADYVSTAMMWG